MRYLEDFFVELKQLHIEIWAEDGRLRFKAPKGALNDALRAELAERKEEILDFFRRKALFEQPISRLAENEAAPISFAQQRLLFLEQLEEQRAVYNIPAVFRCEGLLDEKTLAASLLALIARHESLRTCFPSLDGETTACLCKAYNPLHVSDLSALPELEQEKRIQELISEHAQLAFDLSGGPLLDLHLLHLSGERQLLLFNMHHIISDGWSVGVLIREWKEIYNALAAGQEPELPELPIQYGDYAAWQRHWLEQGILASQLDYWRKQLAGLPELLELPTDFPRPPVMGTQGQHLHSSLNHELTGKIKQISREQGATVFMTLLAAFNVLLHRWSGQDDLAVGSPIANRTHPQTEGLIGFFVNTLVLRTQIDGSQSFLELLRLLRQTALEAYSHQDIPFDYLVEQLNPTRSMSHAPLFQVMFALQNTPQEELVLGGAKLTLLKPDYKIAKSDLSLSMTEQDGCLACDWEYRTDLFQPETIARMAERFQVLLEGILAAPEQPISCLPLLTAADVKQLTNWNQTEADLPTDKTVVELFEAQAAKNPNRTALVFAEQQLTYTELNRRANQLAHHLIQLGVGPETLVGLCVERSPEMIVGLLGILKAGGAYVPLDPEYPQERLHFMIEDSGLKVLVTQSSLLERLPDFSGQTVRVDDPVAFADQPKENPLRQSGPDHLAYVIYTSGSTGKPKGVLIEHAALSQHLHASLVRYAMQADDRVLQFTSLNFDPSVEQIFTTLCSGARLIGVRSSLLQADELQRLIAANKVTVADLPPIYWQQFLQHANPAQLASLRLLILGGEALSFDLARQSRSFLPDAATILNAYGPTEATVSSSLFEIADQLQVVGKGMAVPIGRPLAGTKLYIVDAQLRLVPPGVPGELCIAGSRLARGYLHRSELTAEKFVELELFGQKERMYRTGDLARWLPDGNIEYLGRLDQQVKLRGFRIELGEIETALTRHEAILEAAVVCYENEDNKLLAAYVTAADGRELDPALLRAFLKQSLPEWMIPASFTVLDRLPLTPNGKLDRRALPAPAAPPRQTTLAKPQTVLEQQIAAVWQKVLKLEQISIHDNFFDLGGHSLLLLQVQSQLQKILQQALAVVTLFQYPTIQSLAAHLSGNVAEKSPQPPIVAAQNSNDDDVAIIGMAGRFPGAKNIDEFWENLRNGLESISFFSDEELLASGVEPKLFNRPDYVRAGGVLEQAEYFDAPFFGYPPKEAELLDPQQRLFLETAWTAVEHAGYDVSRMPCPVGIFAGAGTSTYFLNNLLPNQELLAQVGRQQVLMGGDKDFLAARAAYKLDLRGPALSVHTACSTSLVAVHIARQSLLHNECRMVLAGGVTVFFPQKQGYLYQEGMILSPDGHCRAFDAEAQGAVGGAGVAVVVLKRLSHALQDGDTVHAVIKGSAINNDGLGRIGFTAPSVEGQARVISEAMQGLDYESISYLEAHGTATILGDPIEISALNQAYRPHTSKTGYCALGSVKTNVGHLDTAAGVTGLIKTVLALQHREIPPSLHFKSPNPQIDFADSPFFVNTELRSWEAQPRRAGVSSFGIGGTNAHVVLEEAPPQKSSASRPWQLLCLSAKTENALRQYRSDLAAFLKNTAELELADLAFTLHAGRSTFAHRGFIVGRDRSELAEQLGQEKCKQWHRSRTAEQPVQVVFMFPGQGSQYVNMALGLYQQEAKFRAVVDECAELLLPHLNLDIRELIYPAGTEQPDMKGSQAAQPALFVIEYALAQLCMAWGIQPAAMIGHSIGEYVAACLAGVFSLPDALRLVAVRGRLMQTVPAGEMLGILLPKSEVEPLLPEGVFIAAHNAPNLTTVSGSAAAISSFSEQLASQRIMHSRLQTLNAAHSPMMQPMLPQFRAELEKIPRNPPQRPYISNLTGTWITPEQVLSTDYWCQHLLKPVQFSQGLQTLLEQNADILLELGPEMVLTSFAQQHRLLHKNLTALNLLRTANSTQEDIAWLLNTLGQLWLKNVPIDWAAFYAEEQRLRIPAPTYPFERQRYWIEPVVRQQQESMVESRQAISEKAVSLPAGSARPRPDSDVDYVAPRTETERKIAEIWQLLLGVEQIGIYDDFFKLGGNSLLGVQVLSRLRETFSATIPLDVLFKHPILEDIAKWLAMRQEIERAALPPLLPQAADAPLVMSFGQQRLHFLAQLEGQSAAYNLPGVLHLSGKLDENALRQAFSALIARHESLRFSFPVINGEAAVQRIAAYDPLEIQDISELMPEAQHRFAKDWIAAHAQAPFNLSSGPLLRLHLLKLRAEEHLLLLNMHHIISDAWTIGILIRDWSELYTAYAQNRKPVLPDLAIQYTDYAAWQRKWLQGEVLERQLAYWREKLAAAPELLELPTDYPRPAVTSYQGSHLKSSLDKKLTQHIKQFSQEQGATVFMTLLAAFKVMLFRYSGQRDLLVGSPIANRTHHATENLVGFFVNTLVLRTVVAEQADFLHLLQQIKQTALEAYNRQDIPFEYLVEQINPRRSLSHAPLFQVMFVVQNAPEHRLQLADLTATVLESENRTSKFDLTLSIEEREGRFVCDWEYSTDLFRPETLARMSEHFQVLLHGILADPQQQIARLPLLTAAEKQQIAQWNDTAADYPRDKTLADLFEAQAAKNPDDFAVVFAEERLTYGQLNEKACQVAQVLMERGVQADTLVGICAERSPEIIIGLLGILKAGGAYVPLDPDYPEERLRFMLDDCGAQILLTQRHLHERLRDFVGTMLDLDDPLFAEQTAENPARRSTPESLAYVIYTSGSTGTPKGVMIEQGSVMTLLHGFEQLAPTSQPLRGMTVCPFSFDVSVWEIFTCLCFGGSLYLLDLQRGITPAELAERLLEEQINSMYLPPALLEPLANELEQRTAILDWQRLLVGVEPISQGLMQRYRNLAPSLHILNGYGPTEATVCASVHLFAQADEPAQRMPIGRPLPGYRIYLLDAQMQPVPLGVPGELCIASDGLARGYLNRPELTAEKFIELELFGKRERIYRSGDLARWLPDGQIEYLGRIDHQVKLRGFRIELGEIEAALTRHEAVAEAVVVLRENQGDKFLAAYLTAANGSEIDAAALRAFLKTSLPEWMIPASFTVLAALPLTPNGKIDRRALPEPTAPQTDVEAAPLRTETELLLAGLYSNLLHTEVRSRAAHFFELGGHSLLAMQFVSRIRDSFGVEMPLRTLFEHPLLADLAVWLEQQQRGSTLPTIAPLPKSALLRLSPAQERLWFLARLEGPSATYNMPAAVRLHGELDIATLRQTFVLLTERHQSLRMCFPDLDGQAGLRLNPPYDPLTVTDLAHLAADQQEAAVKQRIQEHTTRPFALEHGPLLRLELLRLSGQEHVLLFNMHHIISDGWSMSILLRESGEIYAALAEGRNPELRSLPVQYADYAAWQRELLAGDLLARQLSWWEEQLAGAPPLLQLPADHPRPAVQSYRGRHLESRIAPELTQRLHELARQENCTLFMTLLAAFSVLLQRHSSQDDLVIGSPIAGRTLSQTEGLIGLFVNTLPLRIRCEAGVSFSALLGHVRRTALEAYAHQDVPFEHLVERLRPERSLSHSPLFQVMFVLQNNEELGVKLPGLEIEPMEQDFPTAKFDLTLSADQRGGELVLDWEYASDLFTEATVRRLAERFAVLLEGIAAQPETDIRSLPLLTATETQQLARWNDTAAPLSDALLHTFFLQQAQAGPERLAVVSADRTLTYAELRREAVLLAMQLRKLGAERNQLVAVVMEKGWEQVVAVLGIVLSGAAYLPVDPELPAARQHYLLEQGDVRLALTQPHLAVHSEWPDSVQRLIVEPALPERTEENLPEISQTPADLAYVIYTSGSTGLPKGVAIDHRGAVNTILDINRRFGITAEDQVLALSALHFDLSVYDIFGLLAVGGTIVMPAPEARRDPSIWAELLTQQRVTIWNTVPALMQMLTTHQNRQSLPAPLRVVMMSGDWIPLDLPNRIRQLWPAAALISLGGATEVSIWSIFYPIGAVDPAWTSIPYGRPLTNQTFHVLNDQFEPCPVRVAGQLYIGGIGLAQGYWRDPKRTNASFVTHPRTGEQLYKTGDLGRWLADGTIEFLGREDNQVKIRGHRIELGEIEAALVRHEAVKEATVVVQEYEGSKLVAAYVTPSDSSDTDPAALPAVLRESLKQSLPDYMIPASFTVLDRLPLTANGKIDRKALSAPAFVAAGKAQAPQTAAEELLCALWSQTLKMTIADVRSNFFEIGGHSLLATQLVSRIREGFGVDLPLRIIFELPVLAEQAAWLAQQRGQSLPTTISPLPEDAPLVLSFAQQRLWFLAQLEGQNAAYNMPIALRLQGTLDEEALRQASIALIARHESLRLCFPEQAGSATVQRISLYDPLTIVDLKGFSEPEQQEQMQAWIVKHGGTAFDLTTGPLFSLHLLQLGERDHLLLFNMHHIISDGWSMGILVRDWRELYRSRVEAREAELPLLTIQYTDFAAWQKSWLHGAALQEQLEYWRGKLAGAPELLELPTDYPRPAEISYQGQHLQSVLPAELAADIRLLSRQHGATVFMTLLAAFNVLLHRYSGQTDLLVGSPIANRTQQQTEDLIGFFVNTLVLRSQLGPSQTFAELLKDIRQTALEAYSHQDIPFEYLVEQLNPARSLSYSPLFQVMFILQNAPQESLEFSGVTISFIEPELTTAKFDLTLSIAERENGFICDWEYSTDLFATETISRMAGHFQTLLQEISKFPEQPYSSFSLLTPAEEQELRTWNQRDFVYPQEKTLVDLFEQQAARQPGNIAAVFAGEQLCFAELNQRANQLARHLLRLGVGPETLVGICVERSLDMLVGLLGILKAGGAYVPMDPEYPQERLHIMLNDAAVKVLLTQQHLVERLPEHGAALVCIDSDWEKIAEQSEENLSRQSGPENLAYVIYTSGSTGRPKGVMIEHNALVNFLCYMQQRIGIQEHDKFLAITTLSFDIAALELYLPLISGSQCVIIPREIAMNGDLLMQVLAEQRISIMQATPATWKLLLHSGWQQRSPLTILCGGEAMPAELGRQLLGNCQWLWNVYGPTETTIWSSMQDVANWPERPELIGQPIGNTQMYILDEHGGLVPPGLPGELCIGGHGLARGYLNRPELTAEKFIETNLFGKTERMYRTGDLARLLRNGTLECLGRIDHQVKLRGFRIELGEIEAALNRHPRVQEAAVIADREKEVLAAYVVPRVGSQSDNAEQEAQSEKITQWQQVWNDTYSQSSTAQVERQRNTIGWNSSYTMLPIPDQEMQEWLDGTVERILSLAPAHILEIGCGTGMLLFCLTPHCQHYIGADISPEALAWIAGQQNDWEFSGKVTLRQMAADQLDGIQPGSVDLVILNSVIQYFPSIDYLIGVLRKAVELTAPGGCIFIGDVRNFQLFEAFHASVQLFQADDGLAVKELRQRVQASMSRERELLLDPDFFLVLQEQFPKISQVRMELKHGAAHNEMTRFRYDVTLHIGAEAAALPADQVQCLDWRKDALTLEHLSELLAEQQAEVIEISTIPNARLAEEKKLLEQLAHFNGTVAELRDVARAAAAEAIDPETFHALTQNTPYACSLHYGGKFHYTAVFQRKATGQPLAHFASDRSAPLSKPWSNYANNPSAALLDKIEFAAALRDFLQKQLPAYMLPSSFTVLDKLPLTPNGKIDRKALPEPDAQRRDKAYQAPRDTVELQLTQIWEELLQVHPIGIKDNFFELGGHSLLAVRLMAQIEQKFQQRIALTTLFHNSTIEEIAKILRQQPERLPWSCLVPIQTNGKNTPLFCVHPAGGNVLCYLELARQLGAEQPFYAFQAVGLEADQEPCQNVAEMAQQYIEAMQAMQPHGPYQLAGWSFGGLIAFAMAAQLEAQGESVVFLGLLDAIAPHIIREILHEPEDDAQFFVDYFAQADVVLPLEYLRQLSHDEQLSYVIEQGRQVNIFPPDVDVMQTKRLIRVYKNNMAASLRWQAPAYSGRMVLFQAAERRPEDPGLPPEHGWQEYAAQAVDVMQVPGKHHTMVNSPHVQVLAKQMRSYLEQAAKTAAILEATE